MWPWEVPGWFTSTSLAASAILAKLGYELQGEFEQFQVTHGTAAVLRADTNRGKVYLKASDSTEERVTSIVAGIVPHLVKKPIYVCEENKWMWMDDLGEPITDDTRPEGLCRLLIELGKLQLLSLDHIEAPKDVGISVQNSESLIQQTKSLLSDNRVKANFGTFGDFHSHDKDGLPDTELHTRALNGIFRELYDKGKCPLTLVHGDITENVLKATYGSLVLFDWGAAKIDLPLCDTFCFSDSVTPEVMEEYLRMWEKYASVSDLRNLLEIVSSVGSLVCMFRWFDGNNWIVGDEDVQVLASILADAKVLVEKLNLRVSNGTRVSHHV